MQVFGSTIGINLGKIFEWFKGKKDFLKLAWGVCWFETFFPALFHVLISWVHSWCGLEFTWKTGFSIDGSIFMRRFCSVFVLLCGLVLGEEVRVTNVGAYVSISIRFRLWGTGCCLDMYNLWLCLYLDQEVENFEERRLLEGYAGEVTHLGWRWWCLCGYVLFSCVLGEILDEGQDLCWEFLVKDRITFEERC